MRIEYTDICHSFLRSFTEALIVSDTKQLSCAEHEPDLTEPTGFAADDVHGS